MIWRVINIITIAISCILAGFWLWRWGGEVMLNTRTLNRSDESVIDMIKYLMVKQTNEERKMDVCCECAARWFIKLCDVIGSCKPGWVFVIDMQVDASLGFWVLGGSWKRPQTAIY